MHQIGEVAERLSLSLRTIRYYEEEGLVTPSERTEGGFRLYSEEDVARLELVKRMKPLGFSMSEMRALLGARDELAAGGPGAEQAFERLSGFAAAARDKTDLLRAQVETAEQFARQLEGERRRYGRGRARSKPSRA